MSRTSGFKDDELSLTILNTSAVIFYYLFIPLNTPRKVSSGGGMAIA